MAHRGPRAQRGEIAERILARAREGFAVDGYAATTLQGVARAAGVDTKLVRYYFGSKEALFDACLVLPEHFLGRVREAVDVPLLQRARPWCAPCWAPGRSPTCTASCGPRC